MRALCRAASARRVRLRRAPLACRLATYDGEIIFHTPKGRLLPLKLVIPRLAVQRDWHVGLAADALDHSQPDVGDGPKQAGGGGRRRRLLQADGEGAAGEAATSDAAAAASFDAFREDTETWDEGLGGGGGAGLGFPSEQTDSGGWEGTEEDEDDEGPPGVRPPRDMSHERAYGQPVGGGTRLWEKPAAGVDYHHDTDYGWGGQEWEPEGAGVLAPAKEGELLVDAHVLCSPTVADLDGDGNPELIVAVSYFFDKEARSLSCSCMRMHDASLSR